MLTGPTENWNDSVKKDYYWQKRNYSAVKSLHEVHYLQIANQDRKTNRSKYITILKGAWSTVCWKGFCAGISETKCNIMQTSVVISIRIQTSHWVTIAFTPSPTIYAITWTPSPTIYFIACFDWTSGDWYYNWKRV